MSETVAAGGPSTTLREPDGHGVRDGVGAVLAALAVHGVVHTGLGWSVAAVAGGLVGLAVVAAAAASVAARPGRASGPADRVSLARAALLVGCATVTGPVLAGTVASRPWALLALAAPMLVLDAVDGAVARRTGTATAAGGRLDGELDAAALLVLSVAAAPSLGWWVTAIGAMRYAFWLVGLVRTRWRGRLAYSRFRRAVAGLQGAALAVALAPVVPVGAAVVVAAVALGLLTVSFGRDVMDLERRPAPHAVGPTSSSPASSSPAAVSPTSR